MRGERTGNREQRTERFQESFRFAIVKIFIPQLPLPQTNGEASAVIPLKGGTRGVGKVEQENQDLYPKLRKMRSARK
jgi:hypothetical protein